MEMTDADVYALVEEIWDSVLQMEVTPTGVGGGGDATLSAFIHIHGAWEGSVVVQASADLAQQVAAVMFAMDVDELSPEDTSDALGEVVNMLGGSIKSMVEGDASLSLPLVIGGAHYTVAIPGSTALHEVWFACQSQPLVVRVFERLSSEVPPEIERAAAGAATS